MTRETPTVPDGLEFMYTRVLDAPRELVYRAWTEPEHLAKWWGPKGFTVMVCKIDLRPGGTFHYGLKGPDGSTMWGRFEYLDIAPPERISYIVSFSDEHGGVTRHPLSDTWPLETINTVTFDDTGGKTTVLLRSLPIRATEEECRTFAAAHKGMEGGFGGMLDQLAAYLTEV